MTMKPVPYCPGYQVTDDGRVWSNPKPGKGWSKHGRWLRLRHDSFGYRRVHLCAGEKRFERRVHVLVLETFVGPCPDGMQCRHLNGDPSDNRLGNLKWGTWKENVMDSVRHGTKVNPPIGIGEDNPAAKLTERDVRLIVYMWRTGEFTRREIAESYGISVVTVGQIVNRKTWGYLWAA